jgi:hypothetical protein
MARRRESEKITRDRICPCPEYKTACDALPEPAFMVGALSRRRAQSLCAGPLLMC